MAGRRMNFAVDVGAVTSLTVIVYAPANESAYSTTRGRRRHGRIL